MRRALGAELLSVLEPARTVPFVAPAATWASPQALLAVTDRRLLWLLDDAVSHRVRSLRHVDVAAIGAPRPPPAAPHGGGARRTREGRALEFAELRPATAAAIARHVHAATPAAAPRR